MTTPKLNEIRVKFPAALGDEVFVESYKAPEGFWRARVVEVRHDDKPEVAVVVRYSDQRMLHPPVSTVTLSHFHETEVSPEAVMLWPASVERLIRRLWRAEEDAQRASARHHAREAALLDAVKAVGGRDAVVEAVRDATEPLLNEVRALVRATGA